MDDTTQSKSTSLQAAKAEKQTHKKAALELEEEKCQIVIRPNEGEAVAIIEKTEGPLTQEVYQTPTHKHGVVISLQVLRKLFQLQSDESISFRALSQEMQKQETKLVDLLDEMDRADLGYSYFTEFGNDVVWRPNKR